MGRLFPSQSFAWRSVDPENRSIVTYGRMKSLKLKVTAVCNDCNNGWMSNLESEVQPLLSGIIRDGESMYFSRRDRAKLASFIFKQSVIASCLNPTKEPFFTRAARDRFRVSRQIPPGVSAWFGGMRSPILTGLYFSYVLGLQIPARDRVWEDLEVYVYTFAAGYLVLQLCAPRFADISSRGKRLPEILPRSAVWNDYCCRFWPNSSETLRWPTEQYFSEDLLRDFAHRWEGQARILYGAS
jgi:hypothetical protein